LVQIKTAALVRNNWKKSLFLGAAATYGAQWQRARWEETTYMRGLAREALSYGSQVSSLSIFDLPANIVNIADNIVVNNVTVCLARDRTWTHPAMR
jgi:hypothetical protein